MTGARSSCDEREKREREEPFHLAVLDAGSARLGSGRCTRGALERAQKLGDRWTIVPPLRACVDDRAGGIDDEVAAELQCVPARSAEPDAARELAGIADPHARVAPDAEHRSAAESPRLIGAPVAIDKDGVGDVETVQERVTQSLRLVEGDEDGCSCGVDPPPMMEHLHEVRAADQSPGVAEEDQQEGLTAQVLEPHLPTIEVVKVERARSVSGGGRGPAGHPPRAAKPPTSVP